MAANSPTLPVLGEGDTIIHRALQTAQENRLIPQPGPGDRGATRPVGETVTRRKKKKAARPAAPKSAKAQASAAKERDSAISAALMKGASLTPEGTRHSGLMRGLLGGASIGMDIQSAMREYQIKKKQETAAAAAMKMNQAPVAAGIGTPSNVPF